jgi:hypothetical protein
LRVNTAPYSVPYQLGVPQGRLRGRVWLLVGLLAAAGVAARVLVASQVAWQSGVAALGRADEAAAVRDFQQAVRLYVPASPFVARAVGQLRALAESAAAADDRPAEQRALQALRAGLLGARSIYTPFPDQLDWANQRLAALYVGAEERAWPDPAGGGDRAALATAWHTQRLARRPSPGAVPTGLFLAGFALWLVAAVLFTQRGIDRTLTLRRKWALGCAVGFVLGLTLFVSSLWLT